ncbi:MAG: hypothetical protein JNJ48_06665 [Phycisphaerae bacterium]|nr:hypothetical protein [Phycisphaerae bacterium]
MATALSIGIPALVIGVPLLIIAIIYIVVPTFRGIGWVFRQVFRFIGAMVTDVVRLAGVAITAVVLSFLALASVVMGRWSAAQHYGRAIQGEFGAGGAAIYRLAIGHWARLFCAESLVEGIEQRVPQAVAAAPGATAAPRALPAGPVRGAGENAPPARAGQFDGYEIIGTLPGGGSGGRLYVARPTAMKQAAFERQGFGAIGTVGDVVIKSFSVREGSSLPQIVRESRALEAAKKLGLVLEHELTPERFFYVMRYVPGDSLGIVATRLHAASGTGGLDDAGLRRVIGYAVDLVSTLDQYHRSGLWHKDIKPDNIIVSTLDGRAHLVDFGLLTPMRSSLTLTTHGTEYFRDPEMVRMALKGVKVAEVDGGRFDVYGAGAVLFSIVENSFPAHGGLSQITRRCPDAVRWIVRRAMADYDKRYPTAALMLADLRCVAGAPDPYAVKPADLPSMSNAAALPVEAAVGAGAAAGVGAFGGPEMMVAGPARFTPVGPVAAAAVRARPIGVSAEEQVRRARQRAQERSQRAQGRFARRGSDAAVPRMPTGINAGVVVAIVLFLAFGGLVASGLVFTSRSAVTVGAPSEDRPAAVPPIEVVMATGSATDGPAPVPASLRDQRAARRAADRPATVGGLPIMIMREPLAFDPAFEPTARLQVGRLRDAGFTVVADEADGSSPGDRDTEAIKAATEAAAELRRAVGVSPLGGAQARAAVEAWLAAQAGSERLVRPGAVVWFARHSNDPARMMAWVVAGPGLDAGALRAARAALTVTERAN